MNALGICMAFANNRHLYVVPSNGPFRTPIRLKVRFELQTELSVAIETTGLGHNKFDVVSHVVIGFSRRSTVGKERNVADDVALPGNPDVCGAFIVSVI